MSIKPNRTRLKAVYLTDTERDLVRSALDALGNQISGTVNGGDWEVKFAKSYTAKRIAETSALFADKVPS